MVNLYTNELVATLFRYSCSLLTTSYLGNSSTNLPTYNFYIIVYCFQRTRRKLTPEVSSQPQLQHRRVTRQQQKFQDFVPVVLRSRSRTETKTSELSLLPFSVLTYLYSTVLYMHVALHIVWNALSLFVP